MTERIFENIARGTLRRSTLAAIDAAASHWGGRVDLTEFHHLLAVIENRLHNHAVGSRSAKASEIYQDACKLAALAAVLMERGATGYPYATPESTGQGRLPLDK